MYIFHQTETPHGAVANVHRVHNVLVSGDAVLITINSYASEQSELLLWQDQHAMPLVLFMGSVYPNNVHDFLVGSNGFFNGGAIIEELGELDATKAKLTASINTLREQKIAGGCDTQFGIVDTDEVSLRNILGSYQSAVLAKISYVPFSLSWRMHDNSSVVLDDDAMIAVGNAVLAHTRNCYENSWRLKALVANADTVEEALAILIHDGWTIAPQPEEPEA